MKLGKGGNYQVLKNKGNKTITSPIYYQSPRKISTPTYELDTSSNKNIINQAETSKNLLAKNTSS